MLSSNQISGSFDHQYLLKKSVIVLDFFFLEKVFKEGKLLRVLLFVGHGKTCPATSKRARTCQFYLRLESLTRLRLVWTTLRNVDSNIILKNVLTHFLDVLPKFKQLNILFSCNTQLLLTLFAEQINGLFFYMIGTFFMKELYTLYFCLNDLFLP